MGHSFKVFEITPTGVQNRTTVSKLVLGPNAVYPALLFSDPHDDTTVGAIFVRLTPSQRKEWEKLGSVEIRYAEMKDEPSGYPLLISTEEVSDNSEVLVIFRNDDAISKIGEYTGDRVDIAKSVMLTDSARSHVMEMLGEWPKYKKLGVDVRNVFSTSFYNYIRKEFNLADDDFLHGRFYLDFPGEIIMSFGENLSAVSELLARIPIFRTFRAAYHPNGKEESPLIETYYRWNGNELLSATWKERLEKILF